MFLFKLYKLKLLLMPKVTEWSEYGTERKESGKCWFKLIDIAIEIVSNRIIILPEIVQP